MMGSGIYLITNRINGKQYVGQSINLIKRWNQHKTESRRNVPRTIIDKALKKYGIENFDFDIILECDLDMLDKWETDMITAIYNHISAQMKCSVTEIKSGNRVFINDESKSERYVQILSIELFRFKVRNFDFFSCRSGRGVFRSDDISGSLPCPELR